MLFSVVLGLTLDGDPEGIWLRKIATVLASVGFRRHAQAQYQSVMTLTALSHATSGVYAILDGASGASLNHLVTYVSKADVAAPDGR